MTAIDRSGATLVAPRAALNFFDAQTVALPRPVTPLAAWNLLMAHPLPLMATAFRLRDAISARFGVKRIGGFSGAPRDHVQPGDMLDFFRVEAVRANPKRALNGHEERLGKILSSIKDA